MDQDNHTDSRFCFCARFLCFFFSFFRQECNLSVSELLGSFADNEFMPELLETVERCFLREGACHIPESWSTLAMPVASPLLDRYLRATQRSFEAT